MSDFQMLPGLARVLEEARIEDAGQPDIYAMPPGQARPLFEAQRARWNRFDREAFDIEWTSIPAPASAGAAPRPLRLVRIAPRRAGARPAGTIVYLHGGGWVFGSNQTHLGLMARLAQATGCTVHGVDYALAPEHPFPQGLNDCAWAWRWLRAQGTDAGPWILAGDSAGANLALGLMLDLRHTGEPQPDAGLLFYGAYATDFDTASNRQLGDGRFGQSTARMKAYWRLYLGDDPARERDPRACPQHAETAQLAGLPPLWVTAAQLDPLHDDSVNLAQRLAQAGVRYQLRTYPGVHHGFMQMSWALPELQVAFADAAGFLREQGLLA